MLSASAPHVDTKSTFRSVTISHTVTPAATRSILWPHLFSWRHGWPEGIALVCILSKLAQVEPCVNTFVRAWGARRDWTLYADSAPLPCKLARKCQTMGAKGALRKICLN